VQRGPGAKGPLVRKRGVRGEGRIASSPCKGEENRGAGKRVLYNNKRGL